MNMTLEERIAFGAPNTGPGAPTLGTKADSGKIMPAMILHDMARAIEAVAEVATLGAAKYSPDNWLRVPNAQYRYTNALMRHLLAEGHEPNDPESGLPHAAHTAWNALARLELLLTLRAAKTTPT